MDDELTASMDAFNTLFMDCFIAIPPWTISFGSPWIGYYRLSMEGQIRASKDG
jgi:hypothetical protein